MIRSKVKLGLLLLIGLLGISSFAGGIFLNQLIEKQLDEEIEASLVLSSSADPDYDEWLTNEDKDDPSVLYKYYMWNLTNPNEFLLGDNPSFNEVGPFVYREFERKLNVVFDENLVSYQTQSYYIFQPDLSIGDPYELEISNINLGYQGLLNQIGSEANLLVALASGMLSETISSLSTTFVDGIVLQSTPLSIQTTVQQLSGVFGEAVFYEQWANGTAIPDGIDLDGDNNGDIALSSESGINLADSVRLFNSSEFYSFTNMNGFLMWIESSSNVTTQSSLISEFGFLQFQFELITEWLSKWLESLTPSFLITQFSSFGVESLEDIGLLHWGSSLVTQGISLFEIDPTVGGYPEIWAFLENEMSISANFTLSSVKKLFTGEKSLTALENLGLFMFYGSQNDLATIEGIWNITQNKIIYMLQYLDYFVSTFVTPFLLEIFQLGGGLIRTMSVNEWLFSNIDPLLYLFAPDMADTSIFTNQTSSDHPSIDPSHTFYTGKDNVELSGYFVLNAGESVISVWVEDVKVKGSDGRQFGPDISRDSEIVAWSTELLRAISFVFEEDISLYNVEMLRFRVDPSAMYSSTLQPENAIFYQDYSGMYNLTAVAGIPIFLSNPHFLYAETFLRTSIGGMSPNADIHETFLDVEPITGLVMNAAKRSQFNIQILPTDIFFIGIGTYFIPILWIEQTGSITEEIAKDFLEGLELVSNYQRWSLYGGSILGLILVVTALSMGIRTRE